MSNYIKQAFNITKENIILAQPLVIYLVIISITMASAATQSNQTAFYIFFGANILLSTAFFAGWMFMTRKTVEHSKKEFKNQEEKNLASIKLINEFFPGVGEYFLSITASILLYVGAYMIILYLGYKLGLHFFDKPTIDWAKMLAAQTPEQMQKFVNTLTLSQIKLLNIWFLYIGGISILYTYLTMFLFPAVIYDSKNPFVAFWINLKFLFKNFTGTLGILIFLAALNMFISILSAILSINVILSIIGLVITFYFMTYCLVLIFLYYDEKR